MVYKIIKLKDFDNVFALFSANAWYVVKIDTREKINALMVEMGLKGFDLDQPDYIMTATELNEFESGRGRYVIRIPFNEMVKLAKND